MKRANLDGLGLRLRLVELNDAEYIYFLRENSKYNQFLSTAPTSVYTQRNWIDLYKERESVGLEYYFIITRRSDQVSCGTVRLYNINDSDFTWGSWILDENKTRGAAVESFLLSAGFGFDFLKKRKLLLDVRRENKKAIFIYRELGMVLVNETDIDLFFEYSEQSYRASMRELWTMVQFKLGSTHCTQ